MTGNLTTWRDQGLRVPLHEPLFGVAVCDTKHEHEISVVTDGTSAYAWADRGTDCTGVLAAGEEYRIPCGQPLRGGEACGGEVVITTAAMSPVTDPLHVMCLLEHGALVDREDGAA